MCYDGRASSSNLTICLDKQSNGSPLPQRRRVLSSLHLGFNKISNNQSEKQALPVCHGKMKAQETTGTPRDKDIIPAAHQRVDQTPSSLIPIVPAGRNTPALVSCQSVVKDRKRRQGCCCHGSVSQPSASLNECLPQEMPNTSSSWNISHQNCIVAEFIFLYHRGRELYPKRYI